MTPDMKASRKLVDAAIRAHHGKLIEVRDMYADHEILFELQGWTFRYEFRFRDGAKLIHCDDGRDIDVYQSLYGYRGDREDIESMIAWLNQAPGLGVGPRGDFFPKMLCEYLERLKG